jgi:hypothetical protein
MEYQNMKPHLPTIALFVLAAVLYVAGQAGAGVLAAGIAFILEAKAWSQLFRRRPPTAPSPGIEPK